MDLSGIIIVVLGILLFFGGAAWLEVRSRKSKRPDRQGGQPQQHVNSAAPVERAVSARGEG